MALVRARPFAFVGPFGPRRPKAPLTPAALAKGKAVRRFAAVIGNTVHPALGLMDEALCAVEDMQLGTTVPKWVSIGALALAYLFLIRRK